MAFPLRTDIDANRESPAFGGVEDADFRAVLKPMLAGARARGVADGLELLGAGAVLIDATGRVLHVGGRGRRLMGGWLRIVGDHLVAERPADNRAVEDLVCGAIAGREVRVEIRSGAPDRDGGLAVKALPFVTDEGEAQRLHAVLVLEDLGGR